MKSEFFTNLVVRYCVLYVSVFLFSCSPDTTSPKTEASVLDFINSQVSFKENEGEQTISLRLSKAFEKNTKVSISVMASPTGSFNTLPVVSNAKLVIPVAAGERDISFTFAPRDNGLLDGRKQVSFSVLSSGSEYIGGQRGSVTVEISDDEVASTAGFPPASLQIAENSLTPVPVQLALSAPAPADGILVLHLSSDARYGIDFHTVPAVVDDKIFLPIQFGASNVSFNVIPVNDAVKRHDRLIMLEMVLASGGVCTAGRSVFEAIIHDDDNYQLSSIEALKNLYSGNVYSIGTEYFIEGTITSVDNITPGKFFIEDAEGAIRIAITSGKSFAKGDVVLLNLKQGVIDVRQGVLEVAQVADAALVSPGEVTPIPVNIQTLQEAGNVFQSRYIQVSNLRFADADGELAMYGDHEATDGTNSIIVRTTGFASFRDEAIPVGDVTVSGILTLENGILVLHPQVFVEDVVGNSNALKPWNPDGTGRPVKGTRK